MNYKNIVVFVILVFLSENIFAFVDSLKHRTFLLGTEIGGHFGSVYDLDTDEKLSFSHFYFGPQVGMFVNNNLVLGFSGEYSFYSSDLEIPRQGERAVGVFFRYYIDQTKIIPFLKWNRLAVYTGLTYHRGNYYTYKGGNQVDFPNLEVNSINWNTGFNIRIWKGFHSELSLRPVYYIGHSFHLVWRMGVEYHFTKLKD